MNPKIKRTEQGIFVLKDDSHLSRWIEEQGRLDIAHDHISRYKKFIPVGGTVIDCGTALGDHTITYAQYVGPRGMVIGFDANSDMADCAAMNLALYPWAKIYNVGLSDDYGVAGIDREVNVAASSLNLKEGREVHLAPLDSYTDDLKRVDFIKVDIEGFEAKMLMGSKETIKKHKPVIVMEISNGCLEKYGFTAKDIVKIFKDFRYRVEVSDGVATSAQYEIIARI